MRNNFFFLKYNSITLLLSGSLLGTLNPPNTQKNNSAIIPGNDCYRDCDNTEPQICFFRWTLELYQVLGGLVF